MHFLFLVVMMLSGTACVAPGDGSGLVRAVAWGPRGSGSHDAEEEIRLPAAEQMIDEDGGPFTAHTTNPVHLILVDDGRRTARLKDGIFADVAPTVLKLLGLQTPPEMTGRSLL